MILSKLAIPETGIPVMGTCVTGLGRPGLEPTPETCGAGLTVGTTGSCKTNSKANKTKAGTMNRLM
jgi:hypothetical protein